MGKLATGIRQNVSREEIFERYPWLNQRDLDMVTHNDLDGILTAMILNHVLGWNLVGVYDLKTLYFSSDFKGNPRDPIYVDLDVTHRSFKSLGHHILGNDEGDHLNINRLFNVGHHTYTNKYPLSTALFLLYLYDIDFFKFNDLARLFLLHSDTAWKNYYGYNGRYRKNVTEWFERLGMEKELQYLQKREIVPSIEKYIIPNTFSWNNQCTYLVRNNELVFRDSTYDIQEYIDKLCGVFNFERLVVPTKLEKKSSFNRKEFTVIDRDLEKTMDNIKNKYSVFSYSVKYANKVDVSYV